MLDINSFFNEIAPADIPGICEYHPSQAEYQPLREYLISQGAIAALDSENCESDEIIINALKKEISHWNWEIVYTLDIEDVEYSVAHCKGLNIWLVDLWQDSAEEIKHTCFIG